MQTGIDKAIEWVELLAPYIVDHYNTTSGVPKLIRDDYTKGLRRALEIMHRERQAEKQKNCHNCTRGSLVEGAIECSFTTCPYHEETKDWFNAKEKDD